VWQDLQPTPGRLAVTLRIVLATVIALVLMMVVQLPVASLGLYYIFLVARESPAISVKAGMISLLTIVLSIGASLFVVIISDNDPMVRLLSVAVVTYIAGSLMAASTQPALASIWGFIYCTVIAFWERPAPADALVKASLYVLATVSLAFACTVFVEYAFAFRRAADRLEGAMLQRYQLIARVYSMLAQGTTGAPLREAISQLNRLAASGQRAMFELRGTAISHGEFHAADRRRDKPGALPAGSRTYIGMLAQLTENAAAFASRQVDGVEPELRARCAEIARLCTERPLLENIDPHAASELLLDRVESLLHAILSVPLEQTEADEEPHPLPADKVPLLMPGAFWSKDAVTFALKVTLCVMICYVFYFAVAWPGISTSVTTVFITALGTSGAIKQKLFNRVVGSAIGGAMALGAAVFLFPHMDSITSLVVLVAIVAFISGWWACGRQFGYTGFQIAFSFYLVAFEGFSAPTDLTPPRDRMIGIFVALFVMWIVFDQLWPVRTVTAMRRALAGVLRAHARQLRIFDEPAVLETKLKDSEALRDQFARSFANLRALNETVLYEFGPERDAHMRLSASMLETGLTSVPFVWNQLAALRKDDHPELVTDPTVIELRRNTAAAFDRMADAVASDSAYSPTELPAVSASDPACHEYMHNTITGLHDVQEHVAALQTHRDLLP
jgi:multidrug resistance protein MdtO